MPTAAFLSFRLGLDDGVSVVATNWRKSFATLGWDSYTVAGEGPVDVVVGGLEIGATDAPDRSAVVDALAQADLVVVENLLTIPMNLPASRVVADVLSGRPAILHHHDPPWQRERFAHVTELPADDSAWRHVTINAYTQSQFTIRGIQSSTIYNGFEVDVLTADRHRERKQLGVAADELLFVHPVRAIERKNIPVAIDISTRCGATYWLTGAAEDGYDAELEALLSEANCRVIHQPALTTEGLYAASDLVLFPSTWEGFGNPPIEAAIHSKPVVVGTYPVAAELSDLGFDWLTADISDSNLAHILATAQAPPSQMLKKNRATAEEHLSLKQMTASVKSLLTKAGW